MHTQIWAVAMQESSSGAGALGGMLFTVVFLALCVFLIASFWKVFTKAGEPGWACLIPIYNAIVWLKIAGRPAWWLVLMLIPFVNIIVAIIASIDFAKQFGKDAGFGIGLALLGFIFYPILAFGSAQYVGAQRSAASA